MAQQPQAEKTQHCKLVVVGTLNNSSINALFSYNVKKLV
jgi:hypothetical protein